MHIPRYVLRLATNFTARRNYLPAYAGKGRKPEYGQRIRPLERHYSGKTNPATPPDRVEQWQENGRELTADIWEEVVLPEVKPDKAAKTFQVAAIHDPAYTPPWLLATPLKLSAPTLKAIYQDRWPVEQIPLAAKQMVGAHRQFFHADETIQRPPELALLAGSILTFLAATFPAHPTGFWDRQPKRIPGRFRRLLFGQPFPHSYPCQTLFGKRHPSPPNYPKESWPADPKVHR